MTKNEIALWWKLMEAKAEIKFQRVCVNLVNSNSDYNTKQYFYCAMFWARVTDWMNENATY